jgi:large subunit ribosomal protein L25
MILNAEKREVFGTNAANTIRAGGHCPAVIYGPKCDPIHIRVSVAELEHLVRTQNPTLHPFKVQVAGKTQEVLLKKLDMQYNGDILHADFLAIAKGAKVHVAVPIHFEYEEQCVGKKAGGVVDHHLTTIEVEVLPKNIPDEILVDIANLEIGKSIHLSDIKLPKGITLTQPIDENHNPILVSCEPPRVESEEPKAEAEEELTVEQQEASSDDTEEAPET